MLISCPKCAKAYRVDPSELPTAQKIKSKGEGWFLSCQHCFHEWWFKAPKGFTWYDGGIQPEHFGKTVARTPSYFEDKTDLSSLKKRTPTQKEVDRAYHNKIMNEEYSLFNEGFIPDPELSKNIKTLSEKMKTSFFTKSIVFLLIGIICSSLAYIFGFLHFEDTSQEISKPLVVPETQKLFLGLKVEKQSFEMTKTGLLVKGKIFNPSPKEQNLSDLKFSAWSACEADSIAQNIAGGEPYCLAKAWIHPLTQKTIQPKETIQFETRTSISCDIRILKVDVEFIE